MIKVNAFDLLQIVEAAKLWYVRMNNLTGAFPVELKKAKELKKQLLKESWDGKEELFIDEMPF